MGFSVTLHIASFRSFVIAREVQIPIEGVLIHHFFSTDASTTASGISSSESKFVYRSGAYLSRVEVYKDMDENPGLTSTDNDCFAKRCDYMDSHDADVRCNIDFKTEELFGRGAGISSPQLGITFYFD